MARFLSRFSAGQIGVKDPAFPSKRLKGRKAQHHKLKPESWVLGSCLQPVVWKDTRIRPPPPDIQTPRKNQQNNR
jgi:hypothetical protein